MRFASEKDLYLVTKNTGHDQYVLLLISRSGSGSANNASLGRSSGKGAFSSWTHNMKGIEWHDSFVPRGGPDTASGVPAVTLQAGEQWFGGLPFLTGLN